MRFEMFSSQHLWSLPVSLINTETSVHELQVKKVWKNTLDTKYRHFEFVDLNNMWPFLIYKRTLSKSLFCLNFEYTFNEWKRWSLDQKIKKYRKMFVNKVLIFNQKQTLMCPSLIKGFLLSKHKINLYNFSVNLYKWKMWSLEQKLKSLCFPKVILIRNGHLNVIAKAILDHINKIVFWRSKWVICAQNELPT